jgi:hypothetical protein
MPSLRRKIYTLKTTFFKNLSGTVKEVIEVLMEENVAIKGGFAKIILGEILRNKGKIKENLALGPESETDLDLLITFSGSRKDSIDITAERTDILSKKLSNLGINLDNKDLEMMKGNLDDIKFIRKFLQNRDLTINEVIFIPKQETLFLTDKCLRDTISGVGILSANKVGTLRRDCGRIIASPHGMVRLIRFLVEKKVNSIYLPYWWILSNKEEAEKMEKGILGAYGLILLDRYKNNEIFQLRFMKTLNSMSITNLKKFDTFKKEQEILFEVSRGEEFKFKQKSFREIQNELLQEKERRKETKNELKNKRETCSHKNKRKFICEHCLSYCTILKCPDCDWVKVSPKGKPEPASLDDLFCNRNFIQANVYWDKNGFFPKAPYQNKKKGI